MLKMVVRFLLVILLAADAVTRLRIPVTKRDDEFIKVSEVLKDVLKDAVNPVCPLVLFMDGNLSYQSVHKVFSGILASYTYVIIDVPFRGQDDNATITELNATLGEARKISVASQCMAMVLVSENVNFLSLFAEMSSESRLLVWSTKLLILTNLPYSQLRRLMTTYSAFSRMNAMAINGIGKFDLFSHLPYTPTGPEMIKVGRWTLQSGLILTGDYQLFPQKYINFYGALQVTGALMVDPFWIQDKIRTDDGKNTTEMYGRESLVLSAVAKYLNFTFRAIPFSSLREMTGFLVKERNAFAAVMRIAMLPIFQQSGEFLIPLERATFTFVMAKPTLKPQWQSLYYPLTDAVWAGTLLILLMMPLIFKLVQFIDTQKRLNQAQNGPIILQVIGILLGQGELSAFPRSSSSRLLLLTWLIFAFILGIAYRGNLTAFLTVPKYPQRVETLEQLARNGADSKFRPQANTFYEFFRDSEIPTHKAVFSRTSYVKNVTIGLQEALDKPIAYFHERLSVGMYIARHFTNDDGQSNLYVAKENVIPGYAAWLVPHGAPYKDNMNKVLATIIEAGLIEKWTNDMMFNERKKVYQTRQMEKKNTSSVADKVSHKVSDGNLLALTIVHLQGPIYILLFGICQAASVFLVEIIKFRLF